MTKVYEVKSLLISSLGIDEYTGGLYATRELAEEVAARRQANILQDDYVRHICKVIEHEVKGIIDD